MARVQKGRKARRQKGRWSEGSWWCPDVPTLLPPADQKFFHFQTLFRLLSPAFVPLYCSVIFCEAVAIYGVIVAIILQTKLEHVGMTDGRYTSDALRAGYSIFASGLIVGFANLVCGYVVAVEPWIERPSM